MIYFIIIYGLFVGGFLFLKIMQVEDQKKIIANLNDQLERYQIRDLKKKSEKELKQIKELENNIKLLQAMGFDYNQSLELLKKSKKVVK